MAKFGRRMRQLSKYLQIMHRVRTVRESQGKNWGFEHSQGKSGNFFLVWKKMGFKEKVREKIDDLELSSDPN